MRSTRSTLPRLCLALAAALVPALAGAADYGAPPEVLRGTYGGEVVDDVVQWAGPYAGLFGGYANASYDMRRAFRDSASQGLNYTGFAPTDGLLSLNAGTRTASDASVGAFAGYNYQMDEVVFGLEADFTYSRLHGRGTGNLLLGSYGTGAYPYRYVQETYLTGRASNELNGYGTLRARFGYTSGAFMPFVTAGLAAGQASFTRAVGVRAAGFNIDNPGDKNFGYAAFDPVTLHRSPVLAETVLKTRNVMVAGFAAGAGVDLALTDTIFVRGEYQYVYLDSFEGNKLHVNTVRAAAGMRW